MTLENVAAFSLVNPPVAGLLLNRVFLGTCSGFRKKKKKLRGENLKPFHYRVKKMTPHKFQVMYVTTNEGAVLTL